MEAAIPRVMKAAAIVLVAMAAAPLACLSSLPEAARCEGTRAISFEYCAPAITGAPLPPPDPIPPRPDGGKPPEPGGPGSSGGTSGGQPSCSVTSDSCLRTQREDQCKCTSNAECTRSSATCFPPPDCPASVRSATSSPKCLEARVSFTTNTVSAAPPRPGERSEPVSGACACGCASCASTCDGRGPVVGGGEAMRIDVDALPASGQLGLMVRARGVGYVVAALRGASGLPLGPPRQIAGPGASFADLLAGDSGVTYAWTQDRDRPVAIELAVGANAQLEIDCVVPFLLP